MTTAPSVAATSGAPDIDDSDRPQIVITTEVPQVVDAAEDALLHVGVGVFQRTGELVRVVRTGPPSDETKRAIRWQPDTPLIGIAPEPWLWERIATTANWKRWNEKEKELKPALPPAWVAKTLIARGSWRFPHLSGVITAPTIRPDGSILDSPGYDQTTGLLFDPLGETFPKVPATPDADDIKFGMDTLDDVFHDFPWASPGDGIDPRASYAAALAGQLTLLARDSFDGPTPMFSVTAPTAGTGKSLLAQIVGIIATGRDPGVWTGVGDENELRKRLMTIALAGAPAVVLDNLSGQFRSDALAAVLTAETLHDRVLGLSREASAPLRSIFLATGNNLQIVGDLARRVVPIHLDASVEQPEEREGFMHDDLVAYVRENRPTLVTAGLTLLRAYHVAGRPQEKVPAYGSFACWSSFIRQSVLHVTKIAWGQPIDPCAGRVSVRDVDPDRELLSALMAAWELVLGYDNAVTVADLISRVESSRADDETASALHSSLVAFSGGQDGGVNARRLGNLLAQIKDRPIDGRVLQRGPKGVFGRKWYLAKHDSGAGES